MDPELSTTDDAPTEWGVSRRPLLKALGVGAGLAVGSGVATAREAAGVTDDHLDSDIDPFYGVATPATRDIAEEFDPDHEVELLVEHATDSHPELFFFEPTGLAIDSGDIVQFSFTTPDHTVTAYHPGHGFQRRVPEDVVPFSSPIVNVGGAWLYQFEEAGVYDLYCGPHHILGMVMRIVVGDIDEDELPGYVDTFEGQEGPPPILPPFDQAFLEARLDEYSEANEDAEWVWLTPRELFETDVLDPESISDDETVSFEAVIDDIDRFSVESDDDY